MGRWAGIKYQAPNILSEGLDTKLSDVNRIVFT
jgi:hypothetical protein